MDTDKNKEIEKDIETLNKDFIVVGKTRVRSWHAWLILGVAVGIAAGVLFVANRSGEFEPSSAQVMPPLPTPIASYTLTIASNPLATVNFARNNANKTVSQTFTASTDLPLQRIKVAMTNVRTPTQQITASIRETRMGPDLATASISFEIMLPPPPILLPDADAANSTQSAPVQYGIANFNSPISLVLGKQYFLVLTANVANSRNYYRVIVDNTNPYAGGIVFVGGDKKLKYDIVASLAFAKPSITVLSPNGWENWTIGQSYKITWNALYFPVGSTVYIELRPQNTLGGATKIAVTYPVSGSYSWRISKDIIPGQYIIEIYKADINGNIDPNESVKAISDAPFSIVAPLAITTASLPAGTVGVSYSAQINSSGAGLDAQWSVSSGALPPGLNFLTTPRTCPPVGSCSAPSGFIEGTPTTAGAYTFTITVTSGGQSASKQFTISVIPPISTNSPSVVILINEDDYSYLWNNLKEFKSDVEAKFPVFIKILPVANLRNYTPSDVREILIKECNLNMSGCKNMEGAIFVGDVPYALYDQIYDVYAIPQPAPFMFYYQDLDATFEKKENGHYFKYMDFGKHEGPEIYISWIKAVKNSSVGEPIEQLRKYFDKHHKFFNGEIKPEKKAVSALHCPDNAMYSGMKDALNYGIDNLVDIRPQDRCDNLDPLKQTLINALTAMPEVAYLHSHGGPGGMWSLSGIDLLRMTQQPLLMFTWGCSAGNFYNAENWSFALSFINGRDLGLTFIGKLDSTDIIPNNEYGSHFVNNQMDFFKLWDKGLYAGKAMLQMEQEFTNKTIMVWDYDAKQYKNVVVNLYRLSGPLQRIILGSPFAYRNVTSP
ncbi:MAG: putative Ig domain-containing protein [bacterium]|nr:putative Ig domain-containing protein [bacterium]